MHQDTPPNGQSGATSPAEGSMSPAQASDLVNDINAGMQPTERPLRPLVTPDRLNTLAKNLIRLLPAHDLACFARDLMQVAETIDRVCLSETPSSQPAPQPSPKPKPKPRPQPFPKPQTPIDLVEDASNLGRLEELRDQIKRDYVALKSRKESPEAEEFLRVEIGKHVIEARTFLHPNSRQEWFRTQCGLSKTSSQRFVNFAKEVAAHQSVPL